MKKVALKRNVRNLGVLDAATIAIIPGAMKFVAGAERNSGRKPKMTQEFLDEIKLHLGVVMYAQFNYLDTVKFVHARMPQYDIKEIEKGLFHLLAGLMEVRHMPEIQKILGTPVAGEICKCGHSEHSHPNGNCIIWGCGCISFWPPSHDYDLRKGN